MNFDETKVLFILFNLLELLMSFIHLPKRGYIFDYRTFNDEYSFVLPSTVREFLTPLIVGFKFGLQDIDRLDFTHGDKNSLLKGEKCVVREVVYKIDPNTGFDSRPREQYVIHLEEGGVILVLGYTSRGNSIIVYKNDKSHT